MARFCVLTRKLYVEGEPMDILYLYISFARIRTDKVGFPLVGN